MRVSHFISLIKFKLMLAADLVSFHKNISPIIYFMIVIRGIFYILITFVITTTGLRFIKLALLGYKVITQNLTLKSCNVACT